MEQMKIERIEEAKNELKDMLEYGPADPYNGDFPTEDTLKNAIEFIDKVQKIEEEMEDLKFKFVEVMRVIDGGTYEEEQVGLDEVQRAKYVRDKILKEIQSRTKVIRCKECGYFKEHFAYSEKYHTCERMFLTHFRVDNDGSGFCYWGEKSNDGTEEA